MAPTIALALAGANGQPDVLQGTVTPSSRSEPVRDMPELRLEDWLQNILDRGLHDAISDLGMPRARNFPGFPGLGIAYDVRVSVDMRRNAGRFEALQ